MANLRTQYGNIAGKFCADIAALKNSRRVGFKPR